jgi:hypothetical protein
MGMANGGDVRLASHEGNDAFLEQRYEYYLEQGLSPKLAAEKAQKDLEEGNYQDMAYGGIAGDDGRMQYGIGSWFQKKIMDPIKKNWKPIAAIGAGLALDKWGIPTGRPAGEKNLGEGWLGNILGKGREVLSKDNPLGKGSIGSGIGGILSNPNFLIPAASLFAGTFAKPDEPGYTGQGTGLNIQDIGRVANITDPQTAMAAGLRFSPDVETRKFTPAQMLESYAQTDPKDFSTPGAAQGGRIGLKKGSESWRDKLTRWAGGPSALAGELGLEGLHQMQSLLGMGGLYSSGGRIRAQEGGLMDLGGMEKDYRNDGGFVPLGEEEKADDVPARLSKNEFVFTADAVRNAGGGDMDRGAEVMENVMKNLEDGGRISDESQGKGAQEMFEVSERLSEVV